MQDRSKNYMPIRFMKSRSFRNLRGENGLGKRENVTRRKICVVTVFLFFSIFLPAFFTPCAFGNDAVAQRIFLPDARVNLYKTLDFETYKASGTEEQRNAAEERLASIEPAAFFLEGVKKIDKRITLLVVGMMFCPDCTAVYPYLEAMKAANPFISTRYLVRDATPGAREFMISRTGRPNVPSIFVVRPDKTNGWRSGKISSKAYVETPIRVTNLLQSAKSNTERAAVWKDFRAGVYDEDIQRDLLDLISEDND
jgi:glutaredoxin